MNIANKTHYRIWFYPCPLDFPDTKFVFWESDNPQFQMFSANLDLEVNKAGKLEMDIPYNYYWLDDSNYEGLGVAKYRYNEYVQEGLTKFYVTRKDPSKSGETVLWCGRLLSKQRSFYNGLKLTCEGNLTYLLDILQRPYDFDDMRDWLIKKGVLPTISDPNYTYGADITIKRYLMYLMHNYNREAIPSNRFIYGYDDPSDDNLEESINKKFAQTEYSQTYTEISNNILPSIDGFLLPQYIPSADKTKRNKLFFVFNKRGLGTINQTIDFGKNLMDFAETISADSIYDRVIPLGDTYSTIEDRRKATYDKWKQSHDKEEDEKEEHDHDYKPKYAKSWEDSGYAMPDEVDKNTRMCIDSEVQFYWKAAWYDYTASNREKYFKRDMDYHENPIPTDTVIYSDDSTTKMDIDVGNRYAAVAFDLSKTLVNDTKDRKKRMPDEKRDCEKLLDDYKKKLKKKAVKWLSKNNKIKVSITVSAIDLANLKTVTDYGVENNFDYIDVGYSVNIISKPHGLNKKGVTFLCTAVNLDLLSPNQSTFTLGGSFEAMSDKSVKNKEKSGKAYNMADSSYSV